MSIRDQDEKGFLRKIKTIEEKAAATKAESSDKIKPEAPKVPKPIESQTEAVTPQETKTVKEPEIPVSKTIQPILPQEDQVVETTIIDDKVPEIIEDATEKPTQTSFTTTEDQVKHDPIADEENHNNGNGGKYNFDYAWFQNWGKGAIDWSFENYHIIAIPALTYVGANLIINGLYHFKNTAELRAAQWNPSKTESIASKIVTDTTDASTTPGSAATSTIDDEALKEFCYQNKIDFAEAKEYASGGNVKFRGFFIEKGLDPKILDELFSPYLRNMDDNISSKAFKSEEKTLEIKANEKEASPSIGDAQLFTKKDATMEGGDSDHTVETLVSQSDNDSKTVSTVATKAISQIIYTKFANVAYDVLYLAFKPQNYWVAAAEVAVVAATTGYLLNQEEINAYVCDHFESLTDWGICPTHTEEF